jgi:hypothetical protein
LNPFRKLPLYFYKIHFNIILPSTLRKVSSTILHADDQAVLAPSADELQMLTRQIKTAKKYNLKICG